MSTFLLPPGLDPAQVLRRLEPGFGLRAEGETTRRRRYFDTHEHRLLRDGLWLADEEGELALEGLDANSAAGPRWRAAAGERLAAAELADDARARLSPLIGARILLEQARVEEERARWALLNADDKVVAWIDLARGEVEVAGERRPLAPTLELAPLRGYDAEGERAAGLLASLLAPAPGAGHPLHAALAACGRAPLPPRAAAAPDPRARADRALSELLLEQLQTCEESLCGVVEDLDVEYLHELRVALRKARSVLKDGRRVLPPRELEAASAATRVLAQGTNQLRDLDVFLLARARYRALLPAELQPGLDPLFAELAARRQGAQREVAALLEGPAFPRAREAVERLCARAGQRPCEPLAAHAHRLVRKRLRRVRGASRAIAAHSPDEELHELRIHCKRLRYGLELYGGALGDVAPAVGALKQLQKVLGDFNDLSVQRARLLACLGPDHDPLVAAAVGGLVTALAAEQARVRAEYDAAAASFRRSRSQAAFTALIGAARKGKPSKGKPGRRAA
ncbi:MAG: CHAD domain-containing protein [Planctomycetota bacterium]